MQLMKMPMSVLKGLDCLCRRCIWGETAGTNKMNPISWNVICQPKKNGGLGIRRAVDVNKVLLAKLFGDCTLMQRDLRFDS